MERVSLLSILRNPEVLLAALGHEPHFHDSEVVSIRLDRAGVDPWAGPVALISIHLFDGEAKPGQPNAFRFFNHHVVTFRFIGVACLDLGGFNQQNAIFDLLVEQFDEPLGDQAADFPMTPPVHRIKLATSFGVGCTFICNGAEVAEISPGMPPGSVYADES